MNPGSTYSFLEDVARDIYSREKDRLPECWLVFPGHRAKLFFMKQLSSLIDKPVWAPHSITVSEMMMKLSGYRPADPLQLIFSLYRIYCQEAENPESFDEFMLFGEVLLNDFGDVDKNMVDAADLFRNLESMKAIDDDFSYLEPEQIELIRSFWDSFQISRESDEKNEFREIWGIMHKLYSRFRKMLDKSGSVYEGLAYRKACERMEEDTEPGFRMAYFIGFNALTISEKRILSKLYGSGRAGFYWDYDSSYIDDRQHEAGFFIRENLRLFPDLRTEHPACRFTAKKTIEVISAPGRTAQAKIMGMKLEQWKQAGISKGSDTAVVLPDEDILSVVMNSVPGEYEDINITMGLPLKNTPVYGLVESLIDLQQGLKESGKDGELLFYNKDVLKILGHQYILACGGEEMMNIRKEMLRRNLIFPMASFLIRDELSSMIFTRAEGAEALSDYLRAILHKIVMLNREGGGFELQAEYIFQVYIASGRLSDLVKEEKIYIGPTIFRKLLKKIIRHISVPFSGEPLKGLQIMGILEARALDFNNLLILSMNEGSFPGSSAGNSVIPYKLRKGFGLPTTEYRDRIYAYYFYRLIQRAKNVTLIYSTADDGFKTGEKSRFIYQLKYLSDIKLTERNLVYSPARMEARSIVVQKGKTEMAVLKKYLEGGDRRFSPSALNSYMDCSLKFYFRYVAGIGETDEISEEIDPILFGNIIHDVLNNIYKAYIGSGKLLSADDIKAFMKDKARIRSLLDDSFRRIWLKEKGVRKKQEDKTNIIIKEVIISYIQNILKHDALIAPLQIKGLETLFERSIDFNGGRAGLKGIVDRIDIQDGRTRIIDYKSGSAGKDFVLLTELFERGKSKRKKEIFQTFLYCWLYLADADKEIIVPGIYNIRDMHLREFSSAISMDKKKLGDFLPLQDEFVDELKKLMEEIYNTDIPFSQAADRDICKYCSYNKICSREEID